MSLKEQRQKANLSQSELAAISGVNVRTIQQYENGARDINGAKLDTLCTLALALNCKVYDILENDQLKIKLQKTT